MNRRLLIPAVAVVGLGGFLAACGDDDMSRDEIVEELASVAGVSEEQASCVYDEIGDDAQDFFNQDADDADEADMQRIFEAAEACGAGLAPVPDVSLPDLSDFTIPDISIPDMSGLSLPDDVTDES